MEGLLFQKADVCTLFLLVFSICHIFSANCHIFTKHFFFSNYFLFKLVMRKHPNKRKLVYMTKHSNIKKRNTNGKSAEVVDDNKGGIIEDCTGPPTLG